jgi:5,5'-dehydrodivanillate O-demethylase
MVLTREQNERLVRVGPGTPAGELLRRYWHPVAIARELTEEQPTKFVRILGEDLILFKDKSGGVGLIQDHCAHRGASLLYGRVEERGIACAYHGWLYDTKGDCLECPAEPAGSKFHLTVKMRAYPVREFIGMYWAYLGPLPAPEIPHYDVWTRRDGRHRIEVHPVINCNWFNAMENSVDPAHLQILHQELINRGRTVPSTTRGYTDDIQSFDFYVIPHGIIKRRFYRSGMVDEHPLLFPTVLRVNNGTEIRVPIDDEHITIFEPIFEPNDDGVEVLDHEITVTYYPPFRDPPDAPHPYGRFRWNQVASQDAMAWETQGALADREHERLATSDAGVVLLRELTLEQIERVRQGLDPIGIERDPAHAMIDTKLAETIAHMRARQVPTSRTDSSVAGQPASFVSRSTPVR